MAEQGWRTGIELAQEKGPAPLLTESFEVTAEMLSARPEMEQDGIRRGAQSSMMYQPPGRSLGNKHSKELRVGP